MNILCIADAPLVVHSCAIVMSNLAKQFIKLGHKVGYLGYNYTGKEVMHPDGYTIYPDIKPPTRKESVLNAIDKISADVIICHGSKDVFKEGMEAAKERGIPYAAHTFYSTPYKNDKVNTFEARKGFILYDCEHVDDMFVCNNFSVGVGFAMGKRTWLVRNGVDTDIFYPHKEGYALDNYRQELGIPNNAFVFLFSGSNISGKDPGRALDAFAKFYHKNKYDDIYLVMHTRPTTSHLDLRQIAKDLGVEDRVKFFTDAFPEWLVQPKADENYQKGSFSPPYTTTPYEDMGKVFRTGNVLLAPTLMEGLSTTMLEAMSCGLPIICNDDPVVSEAIVPFETGLLCRRLLTNECLTEDIVRNMETLYNDKSLTKEMGEKASSYIKIGYNWKSIAKLFIYHFDNLLAKYYG